MNKSTLVRESMFSNRLKIIFILALIVQYSCSDYDNQKIITKNTTNIDLFKPEFNVSIIGSTEIEYIVKLTYNESQIDTFRIKTNLDKKIKINYISIKENLPNLTLDLLKDSSIIIKLTAYNEKDNFSIDTSLTLKFLIPPIPIIKKISGNNFSNTFINKRLFETPFWERCNNCDSDLIKKASILYNMIGKLSNRPEIIRNKELPIVNNSREVKIIVELDNVFEKTYIADRENVGKNNKESNLTIDKNENGQFVIEYIPDNSKYGVNSLFLICIDENNKSTIFEIANFIVDNKPPKFFIDLGSTWRFKFEMDERYEGALYLNTNHFYGYSPYKVPFTGAYKGDIKELYVSGKRIDISKSNSNNIHFKLSLYLDNGYNQIPVKIIDSMGNIGNYFIPLTITEMGSDNNVINIENNVNIEN